MEREDSGPSRTGRVLAGSVAAVVVMVLSSLSGRPVRLTADTTYVRYYTVTTSYQGKAENLSEIATRFLGGADRAVEIYNLNVGREQPDGHELTDASKLDPGWYLVLPWDAVGAGVQYGVPGAPTATPSAGQSAKPSPRSSAGHHTAVAAHSPAAGHGNRPSTKPRIGAPAADGSTCAVANPAGQTPDWARPKVGADRVWDRTRGKGELVAVVDSGVDGSLPRLTGHVTAGVDVVSGNGRGDVDCRGSGTAMGAIVVAQPGNDASLAGVAPEATVMPVRVVTTGTVAERSDEATAIIAAASGGATVIALGSYVDLGDPAVAKAIRTAVEHDVVVVCAAALTSTPIDRDTALDKGGVLRVGGVGEDGRPAGAYRAGAADVVAPGAKVRSLGPTGAGVVLVTGTQYAVAFAAGEAALVRSAYPSLPAAQVVDRIKETAGSGSRMIDPAAAVGAGRPDNAGSGPPAPGSGLTELLLLVLIGAVVLTALVLLILRIRLVLRADDESDRDGSDADTLSWPVPPIRNGPAPASPPVERQLAVPAGGLPPETHKGTPETGRSTPKVDTA